MNKPSDLPQPTLLLCPPFTLSNRVSNNALMDEFKNQKLDLPKAHKQFFALYKKLSLHSLIYLLPSNIEEELQDLPFVANLGCYIPTSQLIILSRFKSLPRVGEEKVGRRFFKELGYKVVQPPACFEGEADLKFIRDNIYCCGYGIRSDVDSFHWMEDCFDLKIITCHITDKKLYHFDCIFFPLGKEKALVKVDALKADDIKKIESIVEIIPVPKKYLYQDWTNCIRVGGIIYCGKLESKDQFEKMANENNFQVQYTDLSEFYKNGSGLSCLVMHLNYI